MRIQNLTNNQWAFIVDYTEKLPQGINTWYKGVPYPYRNYWDKSRDPNFYLRTIEALGVVKKYLLTLVYLKDIVIPRTLSVKKYEAFLQHLLYQFNWTLAEFWIQDEEFSVPVWEIGKFVTAFLTNLGLRYELSTQFSRVCMMILEFDNAYRYRAQDLVGVMTSELLTNPRKEIKRMLDIYYQREVAAVNGKTDDTFGAREKISKLKLLRHLLLIPKVKKAFIQAAKSIDFEKIKFTDNDRFYIAFWRGYNFEGKTFEQRFTPYEQIYKDAPFQKREDPQLTANFLVGL